jgi:tripartite ATP-independent transporter DctM subunit
MLLIVGAFLFLLATGMPIAFCFLVLNILGVYFFWGGTGGLEHLTISIYASLATFKLLPVPLFVLMGEVMFQSGIASVMLDTIDKWITRLPGRLGLMAVAGGALLATLTGTSIASVALLGNILLPQMEKRGYKKPMAIGPIIASGGIAMMIPPSALAVLLCAIGEISVGRVLIAIILPGLIMAALYASYIAIRCKLQPSLAPAYEVGYTSLSDKLKATVRDIFPLAFIIFMVIGVIFFGIASPSEGAATGALATVVVCMCYGRLNWVVFRKSVESTIRITVMMFMIIAGSTAFSQILAYTGASAGMIEMLVGFEMRPLFILMMMQFILIILGTFMDPVSMMMLSLPVFMPIVKALQFNQVWFAVIMLINLELATKTPPFGMLLFVMKGVAPPDTTMGDIIKAEFPFLLLDLAAMILVMVFPILALWLPGMMF